MQDQRAINTSRPPARNANDQANDEGGKKFHHEENSPIHVRIGRSDFEQIDVHVAKMPESKQQRNDQPVDEA